MSTTPLTTQNIIKHRSETFTRWFDVSCWLCEGEKVAAVDEVVVDTGDVVATSSGEVVGGTRLPVTFSAGSVGETSFVEVQFTTDGNPANTHIMVIPVSVISGQEGWLPDACSDIRLFQWLTQGQEIELCAQAKEVAMKALECLRKVACCTMAPVSVDGEIYDQKGYVRSLRETISWAQGVCEREIRDDPFFAVNNPVF